MTQDRKILMMIVAGLMVFAAGLSALAFWDQKENPIVKSDGLRFKEEYEAYNGMMNESNKTNYPTVEIDENNPFVYKTDDEIAHFLENGTGVIYFGFSTCPWCRSAVPILNKAASSTNLGEILYVDIKNIRDTLTLDDKDEIVVKEEGTNGYREILKKLDSVLEKYYLENKEGKKIDTLEKRLYAPTVVTVKDGKILDIHVDTVKTQKSGYDILTEKEQEELFEIYQKMILKLQNTTCGESC